MSVQSVGRKRHRSLVGLSHPQDTGFSICRNRHVEDMSWYEIKQRSTKMLSGHPLAIPDKSLQCSQPVIGSVVLFHNECLPLFFGDATATYWTVHLHGPAHPVNYVCVSFDRIQRDAEHHVQL
jgi:hypothetical protein